MKVHFAANCSLLPDIYKTASCPLKYQTFFEYFLNEKIVQVSLFCINRENNRRNVNPSK